LVFDERALTESHLAVQIDAVSIDTNDAGRDLHLRSTDFLDVERHPHITFASTGVELRGSRHLAVTGLLGIRGTSRKVVLDVEYRGKARDAWGNERLGFGATAAILRDEFGLKYSEALPSGELFVGNEIEISIEIEAMRSPSGGA
jgi:polyisoprenoid-binding protein YceI